MCIPIIERVINVDSRVRMTRNRCVKVEKRKEAPERRKRIRCSWSGLDGSRITAEMEAKC